MRVRRPAAVRGPRRAARLIAFAAVVVLGAVLVPQAFAATFTVTSSADTGGTCLPTACTLRAAITAANNAAGADEIDFAILTGLQKITVASPLPVITAPVVINGLTQQGINPPDIVVDGSQCDACDGLVVVSGGSTIEGLAIVGFPGRGVVFDGSQGGLGGNTLESSYIGWDPSVGTFSGNDDAGVAIVDSPNNTIGDGTAIGRVVIGGNGSVGDQTEVVITGSGSTGNSLVGNWIGLAPDGTTSADTMNGVVITGAAFNNTIGGKNTVGNTLYAFGQDAINVVNAGSGNVVAGNSIGLDATGAMNQHSDTGIGVSGSPNTIIGDSAVPPGFADPTFGNVVVGATGDVGVFVTGASDGTRLAGNFIGTDRQGAWGSETTRACG